MNKVTAAWLRALNEQFKRDNAPLKQRPWLALEEWGKQIGEPVSVSDDTVKEIFSWFEKNSKGGSQYIGPMFVGAFYYDSAFWPVVIPIIFGNVQLNVRDSLKTMPQAMSSNLFRDRHELLEFVSVLGNCVDYTHGMNELEGRPPNEFARQLLASGDHRLRAAVALLRQYPPNPSSMESARMATEVFLKAFLAAKAGLTEDDARRKVGHNLEEALRRCVDADPQSELLTVRSSLSVFADVGDRYKGSEQPLGILWRAYEIAQFTGATICRSLTGRDVRPTLQVR